MFEAGNDAEIDVVYQTRLVRFGTVVLFGREALERAGVQSPPTLTAAPRNEPSGRCEFVT